METIFLKKTDILSDYCISIKKEFTPILNFRVSPDNPISIGDFGSLITTGNKCKRVRII
jgi:hypothetical protein